MMRHHLPPAGTRQRGATSLVIVMVLLLVMLLVGAYTNRTLMYEQKTSGNQYRSTQAFEAGEAGLEWALGQLNGGRVSGACVPSNNTAVDSLFRSSVLSASADIEGGYAVGALVSPACWKSASAWTCACSAAARTTATPGAAGPVFELHFSGAIGAAGGVLPKVAHIDAEGCSVVGPSSDLCNQIVGTGQAYARASVDVALIPALAAVPPAAVTVRGIANFTATTRVDNTDPRTGVTVNAAATPVPMPILLGPPSTDALASLRTEATTLATRTGSADSLRQALLGMTPPAFQALPTVEVLDPTVNCGAASCAAAIGAKAALGRQLFYLTSSVTLNGLNWPNTAEPLLIVVNGTLTLTGGTRLAGALVADNLTWNAGAGAGVDLLQGMLIVTGTGTGAAANGTATFTGSPVIHYDSQVADRLENWMGTFVRVPGSWKDS